MRAIELPASPLPVSTGVEALLRRLAYRASPESGSRDDPLVAELWWPGGLALDLADDPLDQISCYAWRRRPWRRRQRNPIRSGPDGLGRSFCRARLCAAVALTVASRPAWARCCSKHAGAAGGYLRRSGGVS